MTYVIYHFFMIAICRLIGDAQIEIPAMWFWIEKAIMI
jgi:hypothetical protein